MLVPAIAKKGELEKHFAEHIYDANMFLYTGYPHCNEIPDFTPKENVYRWAIVDKDKVVGYFSYCVDLNSDNIWQFGLYSFERNPVIGIDVYRKMRELIKTHRRIEWRMIGGNPVQRHYDKFCRRYGGNKVVLHETVKSPDGKYLDVHIYEIISGAKMDGGSDND